MTSEQPMQNRSIIDRIKKLNALAENAGTEAEAASAALRVAELCRKHNLEIGSVLIEAQETRASEAVDEPRKGRYKQWWAALSVACELLFDVGSLNRQRFYEGEAARRKTLIDQHQSMVFFGLKANAEAALMTYQYLVASVQAMLRGHIAREGKVSTAQQNQFCRGCAYGIHERAKAAIKQKAEMIEGSAECTAIVRLSNNLVAQYKAERNPAKASKPKPLELDADFIAGYKASGKIDIHGARMSRMLE